MTPNGKVQTFLNRCLIKVPRLVSMPDNPDGICGWSVRNEPLSIPVIGQMPEQRAMKLNEAFQRHIQKSHPEISQAIEVGLLKYRAFLAGQMFAIEDPNGQQFIAGLRIECLAPIPRPFISDDAIRKAVEDLGELTPDKVYTLLINCRSLLTETRPAQTAAAEPAR